MRFDKTDTIRRSLWEYLKKRGTHLLFESMPKELKGRLLTIEKIAAELGGKKRRLAVDIENC